MLSVADALAAVLRHAAPLADEPVPLERALGRTLAQAVVSEIDSPPFDKALMDGFAVRSADLAAAPMTLEVLETVTAGQTASRPVVAGAATRIMTGAPLSEGADAVVPVERTTVAGGGRVSFNETIQAGANILRRGDSVRAGETVYDAGHLLRPQDLGVLAELGAAFPRLRRRPRVAVLATGDELVGPHETPGPGQIRNSNQSLLIGLVAASGAEPVPLGVARDDRADLRAKIGAGLLCDVLVLSGGVSAGLLDLVPSVLQEAGVKEVFHKIDLKPGKPLCYGIWEPSAAPKDYAVDDGRCLTFGLPGNPVAVLTCFALFVAPALRALLGQPNPAPRTVPARLTTPFENRSDRLTYHPATAAFDADGRLTVALVRWAGSADLRATALANASAAFAPRRSYAAGESVPIVPWPARDLSD